jgi:hypothetical protein
MSIERVQLGTLVEDLSIYPRGSVSEVNVADLVYALDGGVELPVPVIDRNTRKIVDGVHRTRAHRRRLGADGVIEADVQEFDDDAAMLLESARLNSQQGLKLGRYDQRVTLLKLRQLGVTDEEAAGALGVTPARLLQIVVRVAKSDVGDVPLKRGTEHLGGSYLTEAQREEIRRMRGAPARAKANELTRLLRQDLANVKNDPELRAVLAQLAAVITEVLEPFNGD